MTRIRSTDARLAELKRWLKKNRMATCKDFVRETGGSKNQYYYLRADLGINKRNAVLSEAMRQVAAQRKAKAAASTTKAIVATTAAEINEANEKFLSDLSAPKAEEVKVEGNTPDFIWYEMSLMQRKLEDVSNRLNHVMRVSQSRDVDQKKMMRELINENSELRVSNNDLRQQVSELTEMINGAPV